VQFEFATAARIVFGAGTLGHVGDIAAGFGSRALLVTGTSPDRGVPVMERLDAAGLTYEVLTVDGEPTVDVVREGVARAVAAGSDVVVGFGGGSAIDAAKAIAAMLGNGGDLFDHLEVVGAGRPLERPSVPWIAIPTTAGTGSEVTRNAVLASPRHGVKVSLRSPSMLARVALVDPTLTHSLPPAVTAGSGLDALAQLVEPFTSSRANPFTDGFCREGMSRVARSFEVAFDSARTGAPAPDAREDMSMAALLGGLALANAGLGAAHGFAAPIGGRFDAPHGAVCGRLLPPVVAVNVAALRERAPGSFALPRYDEVARVLTSRPDATADDLVRWLERLVEALGVPRLSTYGLGAGDVPDLVAAASVASSMRANPIRLTPEELTRVLDAAV
jgi:alcohol dehydrogenase class IV